MGLEVVVGLALIAKTESGVVRRGYISTRLRSIALDPSCLTPKPPGMILILTWKDRDAARPHDEERGRRGMLR